MGNQLATIWMVDVMDQAEAGVDYSSRFGALCPSCGARANIVTTRPWEGNIRIRYHQCNKKGCVLANACKKIKSIEEG